MGAGLFPRFFIVHLLLLTRECEEGHPPPGIAEGALWAGCIRESRPGRAGRSARATPADQATSDRGMLPNW